MNVLDSPLEALAFNYLSFGFLTLLNNLWTWLALLTAALSFWKIRSAACPKPDFHYPSDDATPTVPDPVPEAVTVSKQEPLGRAVVGDGDFDGVRKGKFTVYYEEDVQCEESEGLLLTTVTEEWKEKNGCESEWWERWERLLSLRNGENEDGWYTCQDLTKLNGNVVRLWDGGLRFGYGGTFTRESWYSSSCIHAC